MGGGGGVFEAKLLEAKYELKLNWNFLGGGGKGAGQNKKPFVEGVWIFSGTAQLQEWKWKFLG